MSSPEPRVGIFWTWNGSLFHAESCPISKGVATDVSVDYAVGHYAAWFIMGRRGILDRLPPLQREEYDLIPRGRVVYLFAKESFVIYHGDDFGEDTRAEVIDLFHLDQSPYVDEVDEHYNPLPEDFIF